MLNIFIWTSQRIFTSYSLKWNESFGLLISSSLLIQCFQCCWITTSFLNCQAINLEIVLDFPYFILIISVQVLLFPNHLELVPFCLSSDIYRSCWTNGIMSCCSPRFLSLTFTSLPKRSFKNTNLIEPLCHHACSPLPSGQPTNFTLRHGVHPGTFLHL